MSGLLQLLFGGERALGNGDTLAPFTHPANVQAEVTDLLLHLRGGPLSERSTFTLRSFGEITDASSRVTFTASTCPLQGRSQMGNHRTLNPLSTNAGRTLANPPSVTANASVSAMPVGVHRGLQAVTATVTAQQAREKRDPSFDAGARSALHGLESGNVNQRLVRLDVDKAPILAIGEFPEVHPVLEHPVDRGLAPRLRSLRSGDAVTFEVFGEFFGSRAVDAQLEQLSDDRRSIGVGFEASILTGAVTDRRTIVDGDATRNGLLFGALETRGGTLANVGGELEQDASLQAALRGGPVGGRVGGVNLAARVSDASDESVGVLAVTGETVKPCDDDAGGLTAFDSSERMLQAGAVPLAAGLVQVNDDLAHGEVLMGCEFAPTLLLLVGGDEVLPAAYTADADVEVNWQHVGLKTTRSSGALLEADQPEGRQPSATQEPSSRR